MFNSHYIIYKYMQHIRAGDTAQLTSFPGLIPSTHTWLSVPLVPRNLPLSSALCRHCMHVFTVRFISLFHKMFGGHLGWFYLCSLHSCRQAILSVKAWIPCPDLFSCIHLCFHHHCIKWTNASNLSSTHLIEYPDESWLNF